ncbi:MAG: hypothetical protein R3F43_05950 [bacterium]
MRGLLLRADNQDAEGLFRAWLADPPAATRASIDAVWAGEGLAPAQRPTPCWACGVTRRAGWTGWWRPARGPGPSAPRARGATVGLLQARRCRLHGGQALLALRAERAGMRPGRRSWTPGRAVGDRLRRGWGLSGRLGNVLETAGGLGAGAAGALAGARHGAPGARGRPGGGRWLPGHGFLPHRSPSGHHMVRIHGLTTALIAGPRALEA